MIRDARGLELTRRQFTLRYEIGWLTEHCYKDTKGSQSDALEYNVAI